jgi:very-short-patch-repair endonuclease
MAAQKLRQAMTPAEQILWDALRERKLNGLRFRAQHPIGQFILDFYCPSCRLVVELDGEVHDRQADQDTARTAQLEAHGCRVVRFANQEIFDNLPAVLTMILAAAQSAS